MIRSVPASQILQMRQQGQVLWNQHFSSVDKIVYTTFEVRIIMFVITLTFK